MEIVAAKNIKKTYGDFEALKGIDFEINKGECFGLLGPNGAGKTTTVRLIHCFFPLTSGDLTVFNLDVKKDYREIKSLIGVAPQEYNLDSDFGVFQNLIVHARYFDIPPNIARERAEKLILFAQLNEKRNVKVEELSGGMKRRLLLARSLINNPKLVLLDEPTTGLDPQARHIIWEKIRELKRDGITIILTTHNMYEAEQLCDRIIIVDEGKIITEGKPSALVKENLKKHVIEIINWEKDIIKELEKDKTIETETVNDKIYIFTDNLIQQELYLRETLGIENMITRQSNLEDLFLKLTGRHLRD